MGGLVTIAPFAYAVGCHDCIAMAPCPLFMP